jgi:phospholipid/cholesterol/gamma-HCH transport system substrate-binding protein
MHQKKRKAENLKVGIMVMITMIVLAFGLYIIGAKQNLFNRTIKIGAKFQDIKGLVVGNNIRFAGINIGTVEAIELKNDSTVIVWMQIRSETKKYLKTNTLAHLGNDGLIGNKIILLKSQKLAADPIKSGDILDGVQPFEATEKLAELGSSGGDVKEIAQNLKAITEKINQSEALWLLLQDAENAKALKVSFQNLAISSQRIAALSRNIDQWSRQENGNLQTILKDTSLATLGQELQGVLRDLKAGKGAIGTLLYNEETAEQLQDIVANAYQLSDSLTSFSHQLSQFTYDLQNSSSSIEAVVNDSSFQQYIQESMRNLSESSKKLDENLKALQHNFLFKGYFRKQEKKARKAAKKAAKEAKQKNED